MTNINNSEIILKFPEFSRNIIKNLSNPLNEAEILLTLFDSNKIRVIMIYEKNRFDFIEWNMYYHARDIAIQFGYSVKHLTNWSNRWHIKFEKYEKLINNNIVFIKNFDTVPDNNSNFIDEFDFGKLLLKIKTNSGTSNFFIDWILTQSKLCKNMLNYIKQIKYENTSNNLIEELRETQKMKDNEYKIKLNNEIEMEKHKMLIKKYNSSHSLVYIVRVKKFDNGEYIIKIGETRRGIYDRLQEHLTNYDEAVLLDCFDVYRSKDFENFLHNYEDIRNNKVTNLQGHENELELFLIGNNLSYARVLNIINCNIYNYDDKANIIELEKSKLEYDKLKIISDLDSSTVGTFIKEIVNNNKIIQHELNELKKSNKEILEKLNSLQTKTNNNFNEELKTLGPRLQKINPETLKLIKVYENVSECIRENQNIKRSSLNKAIKDNTIYCNFRWLFVDRSIDPNIIYNINETRTTQIQNIDYIAKINIEKTKIITIYLNRKIASIENGFSSSTLDPYVKNKKPKNNFYYVLYNTCDKTLIDDFENKFGKPILYKSGIGQFDENKNLVKEFVSKYDLCQKLNIGEKSIIKALKTQKAYNSFYYDYLQEKIKVGEAE